LGVLAAKSGAFSAAAWLTATGWGRSAAGATASAGVKAWFLAFGVAVVGVLATQRGGRAGVKAALGRACGVACERGVACVVWPGAAGGAGATAGGALAGDWAVATGLLAFSGCWSEEQPPTAPANKMPVNKA